ncbi:MAG: hypothetical protein LUD48_05685 [Prevotella sp.]|nr:hypothetical protein [Prevotella sp.]
MRGKQKKNILIIVIAVIVVAAIVAAGIIIGTNHSSSVDSIDYSYNADATYNLKIKTDATAGTNNAYNEVLEKVESAVENDSIATAQKKISAGINYLCNEYDLDSRAEDAQTALYYSYYIVTYIETNEEDYSDNEVINNAHELANDAYKVAKFTYRCMDSSLMYQDLFNTAVNTITASK